MLEKLKESILYIAEQCKDDQEFGATKLNKILFLSDFLAYGAYGQPITGSTYFHLEKGPAPKEMKQAQEELFAEGRAELEERPYFNTIQKRIVPSRGSNTSIFSQKELGLVHDVIVSLRGIGGRKISDWTHNFIPWILTRDREDIPYNTTFAMFYVPVRREGIIWGNNEIEKMG